MPTLYYKAVQKLAPKEQHACAAKDLSPYLPVRDGSGETELYFKLLDFYSYSKVNSIESSKPGSYVLLQRLLNKEPGEPWTEDERRSFSTPHFYFRQAYEARAGAVWPEAARR